MLALFLVVIPVINLTLLSFCLIHLASVQLPVRMAHMPTQLHSSVNLVLRPVWSVKTLLFVFPVLFLISCIMIPVKTCVLVINSLQIFQAFYNVLSALLYVVHVRDPSITVLLAQMAVFYTTILAETPLYVLTAAMPMLLATYATVALYSVLLAYHVRSALTAR